MKKFLKKLLNGLGLNNQKPKKEFPGSKKYWEQRYLRNDNSGPGSYGRLAEFKSEVLNEFVKEHDISTVVEFGCGDGNQLSLAKYPQYTGFDVSDTAIKICQEKFKHDPTKSFSKMSENNNLSADLVLSLDVIFHLVEDDVFHDYMSQLFDSSERYVIIYSSNYDKNLTLHVKSRRFTNWIEKHLSQKWQFIKKIENKYPFDINDPKNTSISDFYVYEKLSDQN